VEIIAEDDIGRFVSSVALNIVQKPEKHDAARRLRQLLADVFSKISGACNSFGISDSYIIIIFSIIGLLSTNRE